MESEDGGLQSGHAEGRPPGQFVQMNRLHLIQYS
jgi:hypothetical protein